MRAVLDTNVLISGVITTGVSNEVLLAGYRGEYTLVTSFEILEEFRETLANYPNKFHLTLKEIQREANTLHYYATIVIPTEAISEIEDDPADDMFLEAAVSSEAAFVVSGDRHLLSLGSFRGVDMVNPTTFLEILRER